MSNWRNIAIAFAAVSGFAIVGCGGHDNAGMNDTATYGRSDTVGTDAGTTGTGTTMGDTSGMVNGTMDTTRIGDTTGMGGTNGTSMDTGMSGAETGTGTAR